MGTIIKNEPVITAFIASAIALVVAFVPQWAGVEETVLQVVAFLFSIGSAIVARQSVTPTAKL